jgi:hypothetical protein
MDRVIVFGTFILNKIGGKFAIYFPGTDRQGDRGYVTFDAVTKSGSEALNKIKWSNTWAVEATETSPHYPQSRLVKHLLSEECHDRILRQAKELELHDGLILHLASQILKELLYDTPELRVETHFCLHVGMSDEQR